MRLQKYLAQAGIASRRSCEEIIKSGRVSVNGAKVTAMGSIVGEYDSVELDGKPVRPVKRLRYVMLNKPEGVVTTMNDPENRPTVVELLQDLPERVNPVGRLDIGTEGLLLLTNDGELANRLTHPRYHVDKQYIADVRGNVDNAALDMLRKGVKLDDGHMSLPASADIIAAKGGVTSVSLTVREGHNRLVRRMFQALGLSVKSLRRTGVGGLTLGGLAVGRWRHLTDNEIKHLKRLTGLNID